MGATTFSGPVRAGTQRYNAEANVGNVVLSQSYDSGDLTGDATGNHDALLGYLPAGSQIVDIVVDQVVAAATGTTTVSVGTTSGGAQLMAAVATTAGGRFRGTPTAGLWNRQPDGRSNTEFSYLDRETRDVFRGTPSGKFIAAPTSGGGVGLVGALGAADAAE